MNRRGIFSIIVLLLLVVTSITGITRQEEERIIEQQSFSNEPVKLTAARTKKGAVKIGKKFNDETDWFKGLKVIVENVSGKPVTYIRVGITFPRPKNEETTEGYPYGESLEYGVNPYSPEAAEMSNQTKAVAPGKSIELVMPDEAYSGTKALLKELKFPDNIKRIELMIEAVGFEDGTVWNGGRLWRRDRNAPKGWSQVNHQTDRLNYLDSPA
jgi:hypothetical protein